MAKESLSPEDRAALVRRLQRLAAFRRMFEEPMAFGGWERSLPDADGTIQLPWYHPGDEAERFVTQLETSGWVTSSDWPKWSSSRRGNELLSGPETVASASVNELGRVITTLVRRERFGGGSIADAYESGLLRAVVERADRLAAELDYDERIGHWGDRPWGTPWKGDERLEQQAAAITEIGLQRSECYGSCPAYSVTFHRDGRAQFLGESFVDMLGPHESQLPVRDFATLAAAMEVLRFSRLQRHYVAPYTDLASTTVWLVRHGRRRTVDDYGEAGPQRLRQVESLMDDAAAGLDWLPVPHAGQTSGSGEQPEENPFPIFVGASEAVHWTQARGLRTRG